LNSLDAETARVIAESVATVDLALKEYVYRFEQPIDHVYFPVNGVLSLVAKVEGALPVEVATIGNEGMAGLPLFLGARTTPGDAFSQIPGQCLRMEAAVFLRLARELPAFAALLTRFTQAMLVQISQNSACNRAHGVDERCARWLLMTHDRVGADEFMLTQEFLAQMLGVRRATVNTAASMLQHAGFISYNRGRIRILDRTGLESASCNCYAIIRNEYDEMLNSRQR
jgi:CRP-like cAMP-binding protein